MLNTGDVKEKLEFAFNLYDADGNGNLDEKEVENLVRDIFYVSKRINDGKVDSSVDAKKLFKEMDKNNDGTVSLQEFVQHLRDNEAITKAIKSCLLSSVEIDAKNKNEVDTFGHQAAGHGGDKGLLKEGNTIFKHFSDKEFEFYEKLSKYPQIHQYFPAYHGRTRLDNGKGGVDHYLILEDLTAGMEKPCILDLKMGRQTHEENASIKKTVMLKALDSYSTSKNFGFRVCGMRVYQVKTGEFVVKDKPWGTAVKNNTESMLEALKIYFNNGERIQYGAITAMLPFLMKLKAWFETQTIFRFVGSSILFLYDGKSLNNPKVNVRMVDFAHSDELKGERKDEDYLFGLNTLIELFKVIEHEPNLVTLKVTLYKGENLIAADSNGKSDPYVRFFVSENRPKPKDTWSTSKIIYKTLNPEWNQSFEFQKVSTVKQTLWIKVKDKDLVSDDDLGHGSIKLNGGLIVGQERIHWVDLEEVKSGKIKIGLTILN